MRFSLPSSMLLHGGLLAWALVGFQDVKPFKPAEPEPVEVAIISEDGLVRLRQGDRNAKNLEAAVAKEAPPSQAVKETPRAKPPEPTPPPPPPPEPAKVEPPPPPVAKVEPPPKPAEPQKDEIAELALKAEAEAQAQAQALAEAQRKAEAERKRLEDLKKRQEAEKKKRDELKKKQDEQKKLAELKRQEEAKKKPSDDFFDDMQKALKDNDPTKRAPQPSGAQVAQASNVKGPLAGAPEGKDTRLTASQASLLGSLMKKQVQRCWNINAGADGIDKIKVEIEVKLGPDGRIQGQPRVVSRGSGPLYADMADSAMRALLQCQAYDLPKDLYKGGWDHMIVDFDPSRMF